MTNPSHGTKQIFVTNLSYDVNEEALKQHFAPCGTIIRALVILDPATRRSRGFGFVTFATSDAVQTAVETMNGVMLNERQLRVTLARPRGKKPSAHVPDEETKFVEKALDLP